jgi:hypothetical protein
MPQVVFSHTAVNALPDPRNPEQALGPLILETGANEITWGYGLNYKTYPTYGGEVVQILSAYTDDLVVQGDLRTYREMERVYTWFLAYLQTATQGQGQQGTITPFNQSPISFSYPERGWTQAIIVKSLPGFRYGRDVVVPQYKIEAAVIEQEKSLNDLLRDYVNDFLITGDDRFDLDSFQRVSAGIGYVEENPFSNPFPNVDPKLYDQKTRDLYQKLGGWWNTIVDSYRTGTFEGLIGQGSYPSLLAGGTGDGSNTNQADPNGTVQQSGKGK